MDDIEVTLTKSQSHIERNYYNIEAHIPDTLHIRYNQKKIIRSYCYTSNGILSITKSDINGVELGIHNGNLIMYTYKKNPHFTYIHQWNQRGQTIRNYWKQNCDYTKAVSYECSYGKYGSQVQISIHDKNNVPYVKVINELTGATYMPRPLVTPLRRVAATE